jgi:hypothetical protein
VKTRLVGQRKIGTRRGQLHRHLGAGLGAKCDGEAARGAVLVQRKLRRRDQQAP